ncbi:tRNA (adenosine(37)-N6)-threonylcarbamoyltransferase complex dimerization subunit type 1 TsaB [Glacieibacterium frigidum]|uniref:tRNA (Adenosine(37)-N6)-threonylcarbamoyltransferase complex dimerization subunit type 1 TsaB n=1 Tax=Glacieibacterium frigidum TaxID=2593303 RepID=A0A552UAV0_9SPHN|nr:tRNA (adenosine(37)-N6)-threonylcarbamoyltransferase complex dimerization subunit type 1 TsaB [Glacieibacterium frigidum]
MALVIDTALAAQSLALLDGATVVAARHGVIGRGHAEALMPALAALLDEAGATPDRILVDVGPGSFTGLRIGIAAARALGLAWDVPVTGYASLTLIAAPVFAAHPDTRLAVVAEAGRGLLYVQLMDRDLVAEGEPLALDAAGVAAWLPAGVALAGPGAARVPGARVLADAWPDARDAHLLVGAAALPPVPLYISAPDAVAA